MEECTIQLYWPEQRDKAEKIVRFLSTEFRTNITGIIEQACEHACSDISGVAKIRFEESSRINEFRPDYRNEGTIQ